MKAYTLSSFLEKIAGLVFVSAGILTTFAVIITVGVVYNSARISLQERAWELASLRVLGFTRGEVAGILFGEFAIEIALGIPIGLVLSHGVIGLDRQISFQRKLPDPGRDRAADVPDRGRRRFGRRCGQRLHRPKSCRPA